MDVSPLVLHLSGIKVDNLTDLSVDEEWIIETLYGVDFNDIGRLREASRRLVNLDGSTVVNCIFNYWRPEFFLGGLENIERVFLTRIEFGKVISKFFGDDECWQSDKYDSKWIDKFSLLSGRRITVDDITENIDMDYLIDSHEYGPGLCGFLKFILVNHGNPKLLIKKIASRIEQLANSDIDDIVCQMEPYIDDGDIDAYKMFSCVDWGYVKDWGRLQEFTDFFDRYAPELVYQIPC